MSKFWRTLRARRANQQVRNRPKLRPITPERLEDRLTPALFIPRIADLAVVQTHAPPAVAPNQADSFSIQVTNNGPASVDSINLIDKVPAALQSPTFTPSTGTYNSATGLWTFTTSLAANQSVTLTLTGTAGANATGSLVNTVGVTPPSGVIDSILSNNTSANTQPVNSNIADLAVTLTDNGATVPGNTIVYTLKVQNNGPKDVTGATVVDTLPAAALSNVIWTATVTSGSNVAASGTGNINTSVSLKSGGSATFTITGTIAATSTGTLANSTSVAPPNGFFDPNTSNNSATDSVTLTPRGDLSITKDNNLPTGTMDAGGQVVYTIEVSNSGPSAVTGAAVKDLVPAGLTSVTWTARASSGSSVADASGSSDIDTTVSLLPGGTATFTVTANAVSTFSGEVDNTITVAAPAGFTDTNTSNNSATDALFVLGISDLSITKTDSTADGTTAPGAQVIYTVVATNNGPFAVTGADVEDALPRELTNVSWTATASAGSSVAETSGTGNISTRVDLVNGGTATFTITATVDPSVATGTTVANTASVFAPFDTNDLDLTNNFATNEITIRPARNFIIFVADGLRGEAVDAFLQPTDALRSVEQNGVSFANSHSIFPTFTTPNGAAIATGHFPGDTGDFSNTIFTGFGVPSNNGSPVPFIENDPILGDIDEHFGGNFLDEESLLQFARSVGYNTAAVGKLGPTAIQDVSQVNRSNGAYVNNPPQTVIIDDSTFSSTGVSVSGTIVAALQTAGLQTTTPLSALRNQPSGTNTTPGTSNVNDVQQQYFTDAITKSILPTFVNGTSGAVNPFGLVYWSRDPDGTQHNNGDSLNSLTPGINGPTSQASIKNASDNLQQILDYLRNTDDPNNPGHKLIDNTDIFVTADHGFGTISRFNLDTVNDKKVSDYASTQTYFTIGVNSSTGATSGLRQDVNSGFLPPGFLAIDIHKALFPTLPMFDPDATLNITRDATTGQVTGGKFVPVDETLRLDNPANVVVVKDTVTNTFKLGREQHPINGNAIITVDPSGSVLNFNQAKVIVAANGGSDLIYVPDHDPTTVQRIVDFLSQQDYTSGLFVDTDTYGDVPGALSLKDINLSGSTSLPRPAIVINFRSFSSNPNDPNDTMSGIEIADTGLQQGQGMHGTFGRQDTFNFMAAIGPDFKTDFVDNTPVSNADVAPTLAQILGFNIPSNGSLIGRSATESLVNGPNSLPTTMFTTTSDVAANGQTTILKGQTAGGETYFDVAGFDHRSIGLNAAAAAPAAAPKVILVSLDGATPRILDSFIANNPNSALAQLKNAGIEAQQNTTIYPSLTAAGHIAIATGSIAASNDVVGNAFRLIDTPFSSGATVSGFSAPIGGYGLDGPVDSAVNTATPVWQGILASGQKVVAATFPGADGLNVTVPGLTNSPIIQSAAERTTTFTVPFGTFGGSSAAGFVLNAGSFAVDNGSVVNGKTVTQQLVAAGHQSFSSVLVTPAPFETITSTIGGGGPVGGYQLMAAALDTTDDRVQNYDTLVVFERSIGIRPGPFNNLITGPVYLKNDGKDQPFYLEGSNNRVGTGFFVSKFDPLFWTTDAANTDTIHLARYASNFIPRNLPVIQDVDNVNNNVGFWSYGHDFRIVERLTPSFAPFSDTELRAIDNAATQRFVDYQARLGVFAMQQTPGAALGMVYIEEPDGLEHQYLLTDQRQAVDFTNPNSIGTAFGGTTNFATDPKVAQYGANIQAAYKSANDAVQKILDLVGMDANGVPKSDVIVVSDHGFDPFHTTVDMSNLLTSTIVPAVNSALTGAGLATITSSDIRAVTTGPAVNIYLNLDMRPNGVAGTVSKAQYVVAVPAITNALKGIQDTNTTYNPSGAVALFDIVRGRPLGTGVNDPNLARLTDDLVGQDSGDVFAILKTGYNFDGSQGTAFVVRKGDTATTALASGLSDSDTSLTVTGTVTPGVSNGAFPTTTPFTIQIDSEQLTVTAVNGNTWTVTRGTNGTKAATHNSNALVFNRVPSAFQVPNFYGAHGYDPSLPDMSAIFLAAGPDFGHGTLGSVRNIDIAPTIDQILGVTPAATVQGTALPRGIAPTATADSFNVAQNSSNNVLNILGNDSANISGGQLGLILVNGQPVTGTGVNADGSVNRQVKTAHGTLTVSADGSKVSYSPDAGFTGQDTFTYSVSNAVRVATLPRTQSGTVNGVPIYDGFGSSLAPAPGSTTDFYSLTDRGPNVDGPNGSKVFVLPSFTPQIGRFRINPDGTVTQVATILLKDQNGNTRTGLPNPSSAGGTGEIAIDQNGNTVATDQKGIDSEGLVALPDGTFWVSDEYGPYLTHFAADGTTLAQYGPFAASAPGLTIRAGLPQVLESRIPNKGMEGLTITPNGKTLVGIMQSPLANRVSTSDAGKSSMLRVVTFSLDPVTFGQTKQYAYVLDDPSAGVSEITAVSNTEFLVDERDGKFPGDTTGGASKIKRVYRINLADVTDISDPANSTGGLFIGGKTLEQLTNKQGRDQTQVTLRANGIIPVAKALAVDLIAEASNLGVLGTLYDHDKVEGLSLSNGGRTLVLSNDDDFGINSTGNSTPPFATSKALPTLPATPADFTQFLFIDLASLPAKQAQAMVIINVQ